MGAEKAHHRAEAMGGSCFVVTVTRAEARTSETPCPLDGRPRGREIPKGTRHVRNSVSSYRENFAKVRVSEIRRLRYVGKSHVACLLIMFCQGRLAMPSSRYENVKARHSSFLRRGCQSANNRRGREARLND